MNSVSDILLPLVYVVASALFIFGLKWMSHPRTAVAGNLLGALGMGLAIVAALFDFRHLNPGEGYTANYVLIAAGCVIGAAIGAVLAYRVPMTAMPQMVALLNGFGGAASVCVAGGDLLLPKKEAASWDVLLATALSAVIGSVTFWGSLVAFAKLQELKAFKKPYPIPNQQMVNAVLAAVVAVLAFAVVWSGATPAGASVGATLAFIGVVLAASLLGLALVNPIGGADMPVVIALLNSYSGLAAAATGFVINNNGLIIAGSLVGASGVILTQLMCKAMNRSLVNVLFGVMDASSSGLKADEIYASVRGVAAEDVAILLDTAQRVVVVPGYGLAVSQAQHAVRDLGKLLESRGVTVEYAIHPVAGRMPGHMNVLLAEADVDYDKLKEMDAINPTFETVDVAIVIGANDVVNPLARTDPKSPIAGMPILNVDQAKRVVVIKRSLSPGFAGIPNPLFALPNTSMFFSDGQQAVLDVVAALKAL